MIASSYMLGFDRVGNGMHLASYTYIHTYVLLLIHEIKSIMAEIRLLAK